MYEYECYSSSVEFIRELGADNNEISEWNDAMESYNLNVL